MVSPEAREAVDAVLGAPATGWEGGPRSGRDGHVAFGGAGAAAARRHLLLPVLRAIQSRVGWIEPGAVEYVARRLPVPPADVYGVASFYALLATVPRAPRVAHICIDGPCRLAGSGETIAALEAALGPAGSGTDTAWEPSPCLGRCDRAPAVFFQLAGDQDVNLAPCTAAGVRAVLAGSAPPRAGAGGHLHRGPVLARAGIVDPLSLEAYTAAGGFRGRDRALAIGPEAVLEELDASGLRGRGGAAFPAAAKWRAVAAGAAPRYVVANADESEPGTFKDRVLLEEDPFAVAEALIIAGGAVGATRGFAYVRAEYVTAVDRLDRALAALRSAGLLGPDALGPGAGFDIEIRVGAGAYVCGEETALFNSIEGFRGEPRQKPPFPTTAGLFGRPTVVHNIETLVNVPRIIAGGGAAFAATGTPESTGTRLFCLAGHVARPGVYEVAMGTPLVDLLDLAGGPTGPLGAVLLGGAAGSFVGPASLDLPLSFEAAAAAGLSLGSGAVTVFDASTDFTEVIARIAAFFRKESCGQCVPCRVGTVRQEEAVLRLGRAGAEVGVELEALDEIDRAMRDASICGLGHTAGSAVRSAVRLGLIGGMR